MYSNNVLSENYTKIHTKDLIYFNLEVKGENKAKIFSYPEKLRFSHLYFGSLPHSATFIKKELFSKVGMYDEKLKIVSDWKFFIKALFVNKCSYLKIDRLFSVFYLGGISSTENNTLEREQVINEYFGGFALDYKELKMKREYFDKYMQLINSNSYKLIDKLKSIFIFK